MLLTQLANKLRALKTPILVVAISALLAFLITIVTRPDVPAGPVAAGQARIALLQEEHALMADYARSQFEAERAAAQSRHAEMRQSTVVAEVAPVQAVPVPRPASTVRVAAADPAHKDAAAVAGPPLQLQTPVPAPERPRRGEAVQRARAALATVQRIPQWVGDGVREAANWAILGPVQSITRLPERRFL